MTMPSIKGTVILCLLLRTIDSFRMFDKVNVPVSYTHLTSFAVVYPVGMAGLFFVCVTYLVRSGYNPFIYFNF